MATHDYVIDNSTGANVRADLNLVLQAILTNNSSSSAPSTTAAYMWWADTTTGILKIRNSANNAWVELLQLDGTLTLEDGSASSPALSFRDDLNTGVFSSAADNFDIATGGSVRVNVSSTGINVTGTVVDDGATHDGDVTFTGASANIVFDKSDNQLEFADNAKAVFGTGGDLEIYHNGTDSYVKNATGDLYIRDTNGNIFIQPKTDENAIKCIADGAVEIYHDNAKTLYTSTTGAVIKAGATGGDSTLQIYGNEGQRGVLALAADDGDDNADYWQFQARTDGNLNIQNYNGGSWVNSLILRGGGASELYFDNSKKIETTSDGITVSGKIMPSANNTHDIGSASSRFQNLFMSNAIDMADDAKIQFGDDDDAFVKHTGSDLFIENSTGGLNIKCTSGTGAGEGVIKFSGGTGTEHMRIGSDGHVGIGTTGDVSSSTGMTCFRVLGDNRRQLMLGTTSSSARALIEFFNSNGGVGSINTTGSSTAYNTSSDYRLKENVTAISDGITRLKTLKPSRFNFKVDTDTTVDGFLAHEVTAVPEAITGTKDEVDSDNKPVYQGIDQSKLVPLLTAALQEEVGKREALEARVAALEAA